MNNGKTKRVAALGFFDGVHIGHKAILSAARERANELGCISSVITLDSAPARAVFKKDIHILTPDNSQKTDLIMKSGSIDEVIIIKFDQHIINMSFEDFFRNILIKEYNVCHVVIGENYTCGKNGLGTPDKIIPLCGSLGIGCDVVGTVFALGEPVSSTRIRQYISRGDFKNAELLLGYKLEKGGIIK